MANMLDNGIIIDDEPNNDEPLIEIEPNIENTVPIIIINKSLIENTEPTIKINKPKIPSTFFILFDDE
jgi:hypothetical protein